MKSADDELSLVMAEIARLSDEGQSLPADLHERALRLQLARFPDNPRCIYSLIAILHPSGRGPFPDSDILSACGSWNLAGASSEDLDDLLQRASKLVSASKTWDAYTCLWRAAIRYPDSARPWAEFAHNLANAGEWNFAETAAEFALARAQTADPETAATIAAAVSVLNDGREIERLSKDGQPLPPELHERALRRLLTRFPDDPNCILSLIAILHPSGRAPFPDGDILSAPTSWQPADASGEELNALLENAAKHAAAAQVWEAYTCLWRAVIRYPDSARPWAEYARHLTEEGEWRFAMTAAEYALVHPRSADPEAAEPLLAALATLAGERQLAEIDWRSWLETLTGELAASPQALTLLLRGNDREEAARRLPNALSQHKENFLTWLTASKIAFEENRIADSYTYLRHAFTLDFPAALHSVVRQWSFPASFVTEKSGELESFVALLEELSAAYPEVNLIPSASSADKLATARRQRAEAIDRGLPSAFLITLGKSGSVSVANILGSGFHLPTALYSWINARIVPSWLRDYRRGGASYTTHLLPSEANQTLLVQGGVEEVIVHVRDPRQIAVSLAHHLGNYPADALAEWTAQQRDGHEARLEYVTDQLIKESVDWIEGWCRARSKLTVHFTTFEEFVTDRDAFCERLIGYYGGDVRYFDHAAAFSEQPNVDYHLRRGEIDEWRRVLTPQQIDRINAMIPDHFWKTFNWTP